MSTSVNVIVVEGKTIAHSAELPQSASGAPVRIKAVKGAKYLFTAGKDGVVNDHIIVKRSGKNLQVFLNENDDQPELIIEDYYGNQGELAGMGNDGQYHTFVTEGTDSQAFMMIDDGAATPLLMSSATTSGLNGLALAPAAAGGMSMGWMIAGAIGGLLALGGIAAAGGGGGGGDEEPAPAPAPAPINMDDLSIQDRVGSKTGPITAGGVTDDARPLFSGTGTPGSTVRIYDNGKFIGSVAIGNDGRWQWLPESNLAAGGHDLSFAEMNRDGVEGGRSPSIGFELDLTAPARVTGLTLTDDVGYTQGPINIGDTTNDTTPTFAGKAEAGATVEIRDNGVLIGTAIVGADGSWSFTPSPALANGEHNFSLVVTDPAGNKGLPVNYGPVIIDDTLVDKPDFGFVNDGNDNPLQAGDAVNTNPIKLGGSGQPGDIVTIIDNGVPHGTAVIGEDGQWSYELVLDDEGEHDISFIITNPAGEKLGESDAISIGYDITPPALPSAPVLNDSDGNDVSHGDLITDKNISFSGTADEGDTAYLWDGDRLVGTAIVGADGTWIIPTQLQDDGSHSFRTELRDPAGNSSGMSDAVDIVLDTTAPDIIDMSAVSITDDQGNAINPAATNEKNPVFSGTGEDGDIIFLYEGEKVIGSTVVDNGQWSIEASDLDEGDHSFTLIAQDPAGNTSESSAAVIISVDIIPPVLSVSEILDTTGPVTGEIDGSRPTDERRPTFSGTSEADQTIYVYNTVNGTRTLVGSAVTQANGSWSLIPSSDLPLGLINLTVETTDPAGNITVVTIPEFQVVSLNASPTITVAWDGFGPDSMHSWVSSGDSMHDSRPVYRGTGEPDAVVQLKDADGNVLGSAVVQANGSWEIQPGSDLHLGSNSVYASYQLPDNGEGIPSAAFDVNFTKNINLATESFSNLALGNYDVVETDWYQIKQQGSQLTIGDMTANFGDSRVMYRAPGNTVDFRMNLKHGIVSEDLSIKLHNYEPNKYSAGNLTLDFYRDGELVHQQTVPRTDNAGGVILTYTNLPEFDEVRFVQGSTTDMWAIDDIKMQTVHSTEQYQDVNSIADNNDYVIEGYSLLINSDEVIFDLLNVAGDNTQIHEVSLAGHGNNILNLSLGDVLSLGSDDLFLNDGATQMMITGDAGDVVNLSDLLPDGSDIGDWNNAGDITVGGVTYQVYQHSGLDADLLVQNNVTVNLDNH